MNKQSWLCSMSTFGAVDDKVEVTLLKAEDNSDGSGEDELVAAVY